MVILQLPEAAREPELSELLSESTEFADAAQKWECEKAELVQALVALRVEVEYLCEISTLRFPKVRARSAFTNAERVIRKYESPQ